MRRKITDLEPAGTELWRGESRQLRVSPFPQANGPYLTSSVPSKTAVVALADLYASQRTVTDAGLKHYLAGSTRNEPAYIVQDLAGQLHIQDGHHRLTAAWLRGEQTATVRLAKEEGAMKFGRRNLGAALDSWHKLQQSQQREADKVMRTHSVVGTRIDWTGAYIEMSYPDGTKRYWTWDGKTFNEKGREQGQQSRGQRVTKHPPARPDTIHISRVPRRGWGIVYTYYLDASDPIPAWGQTAHSSMNTKDEARGSAQRQQPGKVIWHNFQGENEYRAALRDFGSAGQRRKLPAKQSSSIHSIGFPRAWNNTSILAWLRDHNMPLPVKPIDRGSKKAQYAWARLHDVDNGRFIYRTDSSPRHRGLVFRFRVPK